MLRDRNKKRGQANEEESLWTNQQPDYAELFWVNMLKDWVALVTF